MKKFSIHTGSCPDDCTHGWTVESLIAAFHIDPKSSIAKIINELKIGEDTGISDDLTLLRNS